jgi:hypothetical protein
MAAPDDVGGTAVTLDEPIRDGTGWARRMTFGSGILARATIGVIVFDTESDARASIARSKCDSYYAWSGSEPTATKITIAAIGDAQPVACRFDFRGGASQQYAVWAINRNVRVDVLGVPRSTSTGEPSDTAAVRGLVAMEIERIDRMAPRH